MPPPFGARALDVRSRSALYVGVTTSFLNGIADGECDVDRAVHLGNSGLQKLRGPDRGTVF